MLKELIVNLSLFALTVTTAHAQENSFQIEDKLGNLGTRFEFKTFNRLLIQTGLDKELANGGFTVFPPRDLVFRSLFEGTKKKLENDPEFAKFVLKNHIVKGLLTADKLLADRLPETLTDQALSIFGSLEEDLFVNSINQRILKADLTQDGNVIHVANGVLFPSNESLTTEIPNLNRGIIRNALRETGLDKILDEEEGPFTVFVPSDRAFLETLGEDGINDLFAKPEVFKNILLKHVIRGRLESDELKLFKEFETLSGELVTVEETDERLFVNEVLIDTPRNQQAKNGVFHVIDGIIE